MSSSAFFPECSQSMFVSYSESRFLFKESQRTMCDVFDHEMHMKEIIGGLMKYCEVEDDFEDETSTKAGSPMEKTINFGEIKDIDKFNAEQNNDNTLNLMSSNFNYILNTQMNQFPKKRNFIKMNNVLKKSWKNKLENFKEAMFHKILIKLHFTQNNNFAEKIIQGNNEKNKKSRSKKFTNKNRNSIINNGKYFI